MASTQLPTLSQIDVEKLVFTIGEAKPGRGRTIYVKNADGTDVLFKCADWSAELASPNPDVRNAAIKNLPHVRSHFHQKRETTEKDTGKVKINDSQTIEFQVSDADLAALDRIIERYVNFISQEAVQKALWPKDQVEQEAFIRRRVGHLAKTNNDGTGRRYMHVKVHYPKLATGAINKRSNHCIMQQNPDDLTDMYPVNIEDIQRNQPGPFTGKLMGMTQIGPLVHPTADLAMFAGCAFDPSAGARDTSMFTNCGMKISSGPRAALAPQDTQSFVGDMEGGEAPMDTAEITSSHY